MCHLCYYMITYYELLYDNKCCVKFAVLKGNIVWISVQKTMYALSILLYDNTFCIFIRQQTMCAVFSRSDVTCILLFYWTFDRRKITRIRLDLQRPIRFAWIYRDSYDSCGFFSVHKNLVVLGVNSFCMKSFK